MSTESVTAGRALEFQELTDPQVVSISRRPVRREGRARADRCRARERTLSTYVAPALFSSPLLLLSEGAHRAVRERHGLRPALRRFRRRDVQRGAQEAVARRQDSRAA